jgi:uncharacterized protein
MKRSRLPSDPESRRAFLMKSFTGLGVLAAGPALFPGCSDGSGGGACTALPGTGEPFPTTSNIANLGPLQAPDENGIRLPAGFTSRVIARSGEVVACSSYVWHGAPDGGACFPTEDGGWIYVSNAEVPTVLQPDSPGGVGAVRFDAAGNVIDAYRILEGTDLNCAGGPTPWGTWITCEEVTSGQAWECDPKGEVEPRALPALGWYKHEAIAIDPATLYAYLTEDETDGCLYRFRPDESTISGGRTDYSAGTLELATLTQVGDDQVIEWVEVPNPNPDIPGGDTSTRLQVEGAAVFNGGEGIWFHEGIAYFATKGDDRVWALEVASDILTVLYDVETHPNPILSGVDNVTVSPTGDVIVAEDGGDLQIIAITPEGQTVALMQIEGQTATEIAGPAFDPSHTRLYFSSQRGQDSGGAFNSGITYCIEGPFFV